MKLHIISAKKFGYDAGYDHIPFPADQYTRESAMAQFKPVIKETGVSRDLCKLKIGVNRACNI